MAGEIQLALGQSGLTVYSVIRSSTGTVWNGSAFVSYNEANWTTYAVSLTEQGTSGYYVGDFPAVSAGAYNVEARQRAGGSPAVTDAIIGSGVIQWSGTAVVPIGSIASNVWGVDLGNGRTSGYFQKGGFNKTVRTASALTVYETDDTTPLVAATSTGDVTLNPLASVDPP